MKMARFIYKAESSFVVEIWIFASNGDFDVAHPSSASRPRRRLQNIQALTVLKYPRT